MLATGDAKEDPSWIETAYNKAASKISGNCEKCFSD